MKRIIIVGTSGSGKSTLAQSLAKKLGYKYIQLDKLHWRKNWTEASDEEFFRLIEEETQAEHWVLDGNYTRQRHISWSKADTIIWLRMPFALNLYQVVSRSINRAITQKELWEGTGNKESFFRMFTPDSVVWWMMKTHKQNIKKYETAIADQKYKDINFITLRSRKEIREFLSSV